MANQPLTAHTQLDQCAGQPTKTPPNRRNVSLVQRDAALNLMPMCNRPISKGSRTAASTVVEGEKGCSLLGPTGHFDEVSRIKGRPLHSILQLSSASHYNSQSIGFSLLAPSCLLANAHNPPTPFSPATPLILRNEEVSKSTPSRK